MEKLRSNKEFKAKLRELRSLKSKSVTKRERIKHGKAIIVLNSEYEGFGRVVCRPIKGKLRERNPDSLVSYARLCTQNNIK